MRAIYAEGTPSEMAEFSLEMGWNPGGMVLPRKVGEAAASPPSVADGETIWVSVEVARKVLSRKKLSNEQRAVLKAIYDSHPTPVLATDLQKKIGYTAAQFAGLMGAFGRRLTHTPGYVEDSWFFNNGWDYNAGCFGYELPDNVREALRLEKLV